MIQYRVTYTIKGENGKWQTNKILKANEAISRKEISRRLNIDMDSIANIEVL